MERTWLIDFREIKGLTQEQVSEMSNIKRPYYSMIETGKRRPSVEVARKIAKILGFDWTIFFTYQGNEMKHNLSQIEMSGRKEVI
ncbi:helix-turn-helix domain-containing protein [Paenibacillus campinasensis]|uniref:Helix-turn-helix domain-containing protein n=1 Tax=Paenibacillus campinasensis TaxID=66347 RepID=A0ABW9T7N3_9BACL|nr:helix-turn-helix transcriptional regulator [Paenibacillus campinasensis]MUG68667.1 helix-turn-helix domain-containing protein [Paenibacillus campinasensis]